MDDRDGKEEKEEHIELLPPPLLLKGETVMRVAIQRKAYREKEVSC